MLDKNLIQSTSSWPFVEIRKLLKDRKDIIKAKNKIKKIATETLQRFFSSKKERIKITAIPKSVQTKCLKKK